MRRVPGSQGTWDSLHFECIKGPPDLTMLDLALPRRDRLSVARDLGRYSFRKVPIILSGHHPMEHKQSAIDAGCTERIDFEKLDEILAGQVPL